MRVVGARLTRAAAAEGDKWERGAVFGMAGEGVLPMSYLTLANAGPMGLEV